MDETSAMIDRIVRERFKDVAIEKVTVVRDTDYEGDPVLRVQVVFDQKRPLDAQRSVGVARHLRHALLAHHENAFPIVAFVSKADAARLRTEAA